MHGRARLLVLVLAFACWLPASAVAAPMPAGNYEFKLTNGTLSIGDGLLPDLPLDSGTVFTAPIGSTPIAQPIGLTVVSAPLSVSGLTGSIDVTVTGAGVTVDPTTGNATVDASFFASFSLSGSIPPGIPVSGSCNIGSQQTPVAVHFDTAKGTAWDPVTGAFAMKDDTFALTRSCTSALDAVAQILVGNTGGGNNTAILNGIATRLADPVVPPVVNPPTTGTGTTSQPTTSEPPATTGNPNEVTPLTAPTATKSCVVPKLVGKTLKQAKRALKKAGCKAGKAKKSKSKKKKGRIVRQRYKAGTKLPAGTKIPLTISKGKKKARKPQSR